MNPVFLIACALMLFSSGFAAAQSQTDGASRIDFRVTRFDPGDQASPVFKAGAGGDVEVEVPLTHIGGPHKATLRDGRFLDFRRGNAELPEISLPIAENERKDLLLLFIAVEKGYRVLKVNTPLSLIRGGDRFIINATSHRLAIKSGEAKPVLIDPGKSGLLGAPRGDGMVSVPVLISLEEDSRWKLASTENWHIDTRFRRYLFAYISPRTRQLAFHAVSERTERDE